MTAHNQTSADAASPLEFTFLAGPTAVGKTALAVEAAERAGAEIVNADAFQLYAGLDILTAKPTEEERARVPHHLMGIVPLSEPMSAPRYAAMAEAVIREIRSRGKPVLVTGGGGFYLKALTHGLDDLPAADPELQAELQAMSAEVRRRELLEREPQAGDLLDLQNPRRVQRALELLRLTGRPLGELRANAARPQRAGVRGIVLSREREDLYERINQRTVAMFAAGVVEEVRRVTEDPARDLSETARKAIGLPEITRVIRGEMREDEAITQIQQVTRRYAKRQGTWFRHQVEAVTLDLTAADPETVLAQICERLRG